MEPVAAGAARGGTERGGATSGRAQAGSSAGARSAREGEGEGEGNGGGEEGEPKAGARGPRCRGRENEEITRQRRRSGRAACLWRQRQGWRRGAHYGREGPGACPR